MKIEDVKIKIEKPPKHIWDKAHELFDIDDKVVIYTYGDTIYNPANTYLSQEIIEHEHTHMLQQAQTEGGPEAWWKRYFDDMGFRIAQEAQAYGRQYYIFCINNLDGNVRLRYLVKIASVLASPMYGVEMQRSDARKLIESNAATN